MHEMAKSIFISYRRSDSPDSAFWLHDELCKALVNTNVFIDEKGLQAGERWKDNLEKNLQLASVLIAVIGPDWLRAQDEYHRRRLDVPTDWVRREIEYALHNDIPIVPFLVKDAKFPVTEALPESLTRLGNYQAFKLRVQYLRDDLNSLLKILEGYGFERLMNGETSDLVFPTPGYQSAIPLSEQELDEALAALPNWKKVNKQVKVRNSEKPKNSIQLKRVYEFDTFEAAMHFMMVASQRFSRIDHHPTWENMWRTTTVWLTTWDNGFKPSCYDIELAEYLDSLYLDYEPREAQVTLSINQELLSKIDLLVKQGAFPNRSSALQTSVQKSLRSLKKD